MNRGEVRNRVLRYLSWQVSTNDTTFTDQCNDAINDAVKLITGDLPDVLLPDKEHLVLLRDYDQTSMVRTIDATSDTRVLSFGAASLVGSVSTVTDGTWDGILHLEVRDPTGRWHRRQCREFWNDTPPGGGVLTSYVSIDRPWRNTTDTTMSFRLYQPEVFLREDVIRILRGRIWDESGGDLGLLPAEFFQQIGARDFQGSQNNRPLSAYRSRHFQMDAPLKAPTAAIQAQSSWGPEPIGEFQYCFTYVWGKRDSERQDPDGNGDPQWESAPSPAGSAITVPNTSSDVLLTLPEIDWQLNYNVSGSLRATRSGYRKRIYRRRNSVTGGTHSTIESPGFYQFLAEIDGAATSYVDNGSVIPGYWRRLPESHGYYAHIFWPHQDQRYEVDLDVLRAHPQLLHDQDTIRLHAVYMPAFLEYVAHFIGQIGNSADAVQRLVKGRELLAAASKNLGSPSRTIPGGTWGTVSTTLQQRYGRATT